MCQLCGRVCAFLLEDNTTQPQRAMCVFCLAAYYSKIWTAGAGVPATAGLCAAYLHHTCACVSQLMST